MLRQALSLLAVLAITTMAAAGTVNAEIPDPVETVDPPACPMSLDDPGHLECLSWWAKNKVEDLRPGPCACDPEPTPI